MDIAAMSVVMAGNNLRSDASIAVMDNAKDVMEQQGEQLLDMLQQSGTKAPHPTLGNTVDIQT